MSQVQDAALLDGERWALIVHGDEDLERMVLAGALPASASRTWLAVALTPLPDDVRDRSSAPQLLLVPHDGRRPDGFGLAAERVTFSAPRTVVVRDSARAIADVRRGETLAAALPLATLVWREPPAEVIVRLTSVADLAQAVHASLLLGSDELRVAEIAVPLEDAAAPAAAQPEALHLLRLSQPSVYLLERWAERDIAVYRPVVTRQGADASAWLALGWRHPWEQLIAASASDERLTFIDASGAQWAVPRSAFRSVFELLDVSLPAAREVWAPLEKPARFTIPLHWGYRARPFDAEIWLLAEEELGRLEQLFGVLAHSELDNLQLACAQDAQGTAHYIVREALTGRTRQHIEFGVGFASVPGLPGLFVPTDRHLEPPVPREMLARLFDVGPRRLQIVTDSRIDGGRGRLDDAMRVLTVDDSAFRPVLSLVEHLIRGARTRLEAVLERTVLDLGPLAELPERPEHDPEVETGTRRRRKQRPEAEPEPEEDDAPSSAPEPAASPEAAPARTARKRARPQSDTAQRERTTAQSSADLQEARRELEQAERHAVDRLEDADAWRRVGQLKLALGEVEDGVRCLEHACWVARDASHERELREELQTSVERLGQTSGPLALRRDVLAFAERQPQESASDYARRLRALVAELRGAESELSHKARWLLWREVLRFNRDPVEATRLTESILSELSLRGIAESDSFVFVRRHIRRAFEQQQLPSGIGALLDHMGEVAALIQRADLRMEALGALATAHEAAGDRDAINRVLADRQALETLARDMGAAAFATCAAAAARAGHADAGRLFHHALDHLDAMRDGYEKDRTILDVLEQIQLATLLGEEADLVARVMSIIGSQHPRRQCLHLSDCAELLLDLGAAVAVSERVHQLLSEREVLSDAYYLEHALRALVVCQSGRPPEPTIARSCVDVLLALPTFDEPAAKAMDLALSGADRTALERLRQALGQAPANEAHMLESCLVRGLATFGEIDEGLELLAERLEAIWAVRDPAVVAAALQRLVPNAAHFGRPERGIELVEGVVERLGREQARQLSPRDRGAVLATCALAVGRLGAHDRAFVLLERIVDTFDALIGSQSYGMSYLFEILGQTVDQIISLGETQRGVPLIERASQTIDERLSRALGPDHPYFVHQARIKCAVALISLEEHERGIALLESAVREIARVRMFDGRDRVDLCLEAVKALSLIALEDNARVELLQLLVDTGVGDERQATFSDGFRRVMLRGTVREIIQRQTAYRLALTKMRAREERLIRERVLRASLLEPA